MSSIKKNFAWNALLRVSTIVFPLIIFPYISRTIGAAGIGKVTFASSVITYYGIIAHLGVQTYGIRSVAQASNNIQERTQRVKEIFCINSITTILAYVILVVSIYLVPKFQEEHTLLLISSLVMGFDTLGMVWLFSGLEQYSFIAKRSIAFKLVSLLLILTMVKTADDYITYGAILVFSNVGSNIVNFVYSRKYLDFRISKKLNLKRHLKPIFTFFSMSIATTVYTSLDTVMLGFMTNDSDVGYYNAAIKIRSVLLGLVNSLAVVMLPRASYYVENNMRDEFVNISRKAFQFVIIVGSSFWIYFSLFAKESIVLLSGNGFLPAVYPMLLIMPTVLICGISNITAIQMLVALGKERTVLNSQIAGAIIDLVFNAIFIPIYHASAAAAATMIAELFIMIYQIIALHHEGIYISKGTNYYKIVFAMIVATIFAYPFKLLFNNPLFVLLLSALLYFSVYFSMLILLKNDIAKELFLSIKNSVKKIGDKNNV